MKRYEEIFKKHNLPPLAGEVTKMRWLMANHDWYAKTAEGWFWLRGDGGPNRKWMPAPLGPPGENP